jgi:positive regulator of sigma E activity
MFAATLLALSLGAGDGGQALAAACGLLGGYLAMRLLIQHSRRQRDFQPQLLRIEGRRQVVADFEGTPLASSH